MIWGWDATGQASLRSLKSGWPGCRVSCFESSDGVNSLGGAPHHEVSPGDSEESETEVTSPESKRKPTRRGGRRARHRKMAALARQQAAAEAAEEAGIDECGGIRRDVGQDPQNRVFSKGVILDSGDTMTCTVPIYDGFLIPLAVQQLDLGGRDITSYILKGLQGRNEDHRLSTRMGFKTAENVKESLGFVKCGEVQEDEVSFEEAPAAADVLIVGAERHLGPEALFQPELQGKEQGGVVEMLWQSVMMADADIQEELLSSIVLCGGSSLFPGFAERLTVGLAQRRGRAVDAVPVTRESRTAAWRGGAMVAMVQHRFWIDEKDYDEFGPSLVHERCF
eukprot:s1811_g12.t1